MILATQTITDGRFGFEDRLKSFLTKTNNHTNAFPKFLKSITDENQMELIKKACKFITSSTANVIFGRNRYMCNNRFRNPFLY